MKTRFVCLSLLLILFCSAISSAQWVLTTHSLPVPEVSALAVSPAVGGAGDTKLFAGTWGSGVFFSTDDGTSWTRTGTGLKTTGTTALVIVGENILAGTWGDGVFRSSINGGTWIPVNNGLTNNESISGIVVSGNNLFVAGPGAEGIGIYRSTDCGDTWKAVNSNLPPTNVYCLVVCQALGGTGDTNLIIGTNQGVFRSTNNGTSWSASDSSICNYYFVNSFAVSGKNLYAVTEGGGVCLSTDAGKSWTQLNFGLPDTLVLSLTVSGANLFAVTAPNGVYLSTNNGTSWTEANSGLPKNPAYSRYSIFSITVSGTKLFAMTDDGLYLSTNNGTSWSAANGDLAPHIVSSFAVSGVNLFAGTSGGGVFLSSNNGSTWSPVNTGLTDNTVNALAMGGSDLFAGTSEGVFRSTNNGTSWAEAGSGLSNATCLAVSGANVVVAATRNSVFGIFRSADAGASWTRLDSADIANYNFKTLAVIGERVFAGTDGQGVFLSSDGGATWARADSGLPNHLRVTHLAIGGTNIFAGTVDRGVFLSTNYGATWSAVNSGLPPSAQQVYALFASGSNVIASMHLKGVFVSTNSGSSWTSANSGLSDSTVYSFALMGNNLFAGTSGAIWRWQLSEMTPLVSVPSGEGPAVFRLEQNFPNPFNPWTTIRYSLPHKSQVFLTVYNTLGQQVATLVQGGHDAGSYEVKFDGSNLASGVYFYRIQAGTYIETKRLLLLR